MTKKITSKKKEIPFEKNSFEKDAWSEGLAICGIDEVGRGCLAGPLVTAAVILPYKTSPLLKDSKVLSEQKRLEAAYWIEKNCWYGLGIVNNRCIDQYNIWHATLIAMKKALLNVLTICPKKPATILVDAMPLKLLDTEYKNIPIHHFPKGESKSSSIAAASIIAKVKRDQLMKKLDTIFPGYYLGKHKGYSTKEHKMILTTNHNLLIHRQSFLKNIDTLSSHENDYEGQQSIC